MGNDKESDGVYGKTSAQHRFKQQLLTKIAEIRQCLDSSEDQASCSATLQTVVAELAASAQMFDSDELGETSKELAQALKQLKVKLLNNSTSDIATLLITLERSVHALNTFEESSSLFSDEWTTASHRSSLVYLVEDDELLGAWLALELMQADYDVRHFLSIEEFEKAMVLQAPAVIIMDIVFPEGTMAGIEAIAKLKESFPACPPVVFCSQRSDMGVRLAAARAGAHRYFSKPADVPKLIEVLNGITERKEKIPYRVLVIDDDQAMLDSYGAILRTAGIEVELLKDPMISLDVLERFLPDVVVLDVHMPTCSGLEVAQVIRQDDTWAIMPIMFLSAEPCDDRCLLAMSQGGDDFLTKPISADHLVSAVTARARRARWASTLNNDLKSALRKSKYQLVALDQHAIVSVADITGCITRVNDKFCKVSGYTREELIGKNHRILKSLVHPDSFYKDMWSTIIQGNVWHGVVCNRRKDGSVYWVDSTIVPFLDDKGEPYQYVSVRTDITALRQSEERLSRSQAFANIGTWDWDILTGELYWSERIGPLFGYRQSLPETTYENFLAAVHPDDREFVVQAIQACVEQGAEYNIEHRVVWPDGSVHWVQERGDVLRDIYGKPTHMLGVVQDIDTRKRYENEMLQAKEEAENANLAKSQFLSRMSHELRTPMNAIIGFAQLIEMETEHSLSDSQKENVHEIGKAATHLLDLINEVLDLARIEAGRISLSLEPVSVDVLILESYQLIWPLAQRRDISLSFCRDGTCMSFENISRDYDVVIADRTRLKQVLLNLMSNAVKYNRDGGHVIVACDREPDKRIRVSVTDTGHGLSREQCEQLFTAFERLGAEHSPIEGTGIGLVISRNMVELMGGQMGVESCVGEGTTFWFTLPEGAFLPESEQRRKKTEKHHRLVAPDKNPSKREFNVLYIEDNPANQRLVTQLLGRRSDMSVLSADEPLQGLELAVTTQPDLILLDINLPVMDGYSVLKELHQRPQTSHIPVIAVSANAMPSDIEKAMNAGFDDYITKPINVKALLDSIDAFLSPNG